MFCSGSCYKELRSLQSERSSGQCQRFMHRAPCDGTAVHAFIWLPFSPNPKAALAWFQLQDSPKLPRPTWNGLQSLTVTQSRSYVPSFTEALTSDPVVYDNNSLLVLLYLSQLFNFSRRRGGEKITPWRSIKISFRVCHLRDAIPTGQSRWRFLMKERYLCSWPIPNSRWTSHWSSHKASLIKKKQKKKPCLFSRLAGFQTHTKPHWSLLKQTGEHWVPGGALKHHFTTYMSQWYFNHFPSACVSVSDTSKKFPSANVVCFY